MKYNANPSLQTLLIFAALLYAFSSCTTRNEEEIFAELDCDTEGVTYSGFVLPLLESRCISCHNSQLPSGNVNLENYENLVTVVENGRFLGAIRHEPGFSNMPQGQAQLSSCQIENIEAWIDQGFPNN